VYVDGVTVSPVEQAEPKLTTEVQMAAEPPNFPIAIPELGIELWVEAGSSSHRMTTGITLDSVTASSPPTHPALLSDGGGTDVGGVGSHLTQDIGTETNFVEETTASHQTHDTGAGASATPADEAGNGWVAPDGWIANEAGNSWVAPDGAHWGATLPMEQPPLKLASDKGSQQRALERREECLRRSNDEPPVHDEHQSYDFDEEDGDTITPQQRKKDCRDWHTKRYGDVSGAIKAHVSREMLVEDKFVVKHRCRTYDKDCETAVDMRTPSPEPHASAEDAPPTSDEGVSEVTLRTTKRGCRDWHPPTGRKGPNGEG
jgi:hypothetical protein